MKTKSTLFAFFFLAISVGLFSCSKESSLAPDVSYLELPASTASYNSPFGSDNLATLGRVLFYDARLSANNSISCASCHKQAIAFSDHVAKSFGFENQLTGRNSLPIQNLGFFAGQGLPSLFWDGREEFLNSMVLKPIVNHVEMGMGDMNAIVNKVRSVTYYGPLFTKAFGTEDIDINKIARALATFTAAITSNNTRFDQFQQNQLSLNALEEQGRGLFFTKYDCNSCHQTQVPNGYQLGGGDGFVNIGLDADYTDNGRGEITHSSADNGKFKIPNLRNIALTGPYMHDGRFNTLDEVLNHYSHGIQDHPNLDERLRSSSHLPLQMNITAQEKSAIIAFLNSLTDFSMITDPKFSSPFVTH